MFRMTTFKPSVLHGDFSSPSSPVSSVAGDVMPYMKRLSISDSGRGSSGSDSGSQSGEPPYGVLPTFTGMYKLFVLCCFV